MNVSVVFALKFIHHCLQDYQDVETYGDNSICVDGVKSSSSYSCGTYIRKPVMSLCVAEETYTVNGSDRYALLIEGLHV